MALSPLLNLYPDLNMEMYYISFKRIVRPLLNKVSHALGGLSGKPLLANGLKRRNDAERIADNDRQRYYAQALAGSWQGSRYLR